MGGAAVRGTIDSSAQQPHSLLLLSNLSPQVIVLDPRLSAPELLRRSSSSDGGGPNLHRHYRAEEGTD